MNQRELNREISKKTGETVATISQMGFVPLTAVPYEREPQTVDWEKTDADRHVAVTSRRARTPVVV